MNLFHFYDNYQFILYIYYLHVFMTIINSFQIQIFNSSKKMN